MTSQGCGESAHQRLARGPLENNVTLFPLSLPTQSLSEQPLTAAAFKKRGTRECSVSGQGRSALPGASLSIVCLLSSALLEAVVTCAYFGRVGKARIHKANL